MQGRDGLILCADILETREDTRNWVTKIDKINEDCVFGGATSDSTFLLDFVDLLKDRLQSAGRNPRFKAIIDSTIREYTNSVDRDYGNSSPRLYAEIQQRSRVQGVLARRRHLARGKFSFDLYSIDTPSRAEIRDMTATAGTGGIYANLLFQGTERILNLFQLSWKTFSVKLLAQFCYLMIATVIQYDNNSAGFDVYELSQNSSRLIPTYDVFPNKPKEKYRLPILLENAFNEIGKKKVLEMIEKYDLLDIVQRKFKNKDLLEKVTSAVLKELES